MTAPSSLPAVKLFALPIQCHPTWISCCTRYSTIGRRASEINIFEDYSISGKRIYARVVPAANAITLRENSQRQ